MATRKPLSKKLRFEVFKRDKFTCQYCGRSAPDVILEVDHIMPVKEGGTNDIMNLVTACKECNRGKGARELSNDSTVQKQKAQIAELAEKNEQLQMLLQWRDGMKEIAEKEADAIESVIKEFTEDSFCINENGRKKIRMWRKTYSISELLRATEDACTSYFDGTPGSVEIAFNKIPKIAWANAHPVENEYQKRIFYLRKILINRFRLNDYQKAKSYRLIGGVLDCLSFEEVKSICSSCQSYREFEEIIGEYISDGYQRE